MTRIGLNAIILGFVSVCVYRNDCMLADEAILCKASVYAPSQDYIVMTSENPGFIANGG